MMRARLLAFGGALLLFVASCGLPSIKPPSLP
jgi:hypothetical protein